MTKIIENYCLEESIGEGQYGKVYKAKDTKNNNKLVAIKVVKIQKFKENPKLEECTINEIRILSKVEDNEHVVKFIELLKTSNNYYFVYEFCSGGTLETFIQSQNFLQEKKANQFLSQLLNAFKCLSKHNILHRDLKPTNILLEKDKIKLADFGFCRPLKHQNEMVQTMLGSPIYMAPEVLRGQEYCINADIWSLGVVYFEMLFGYCPFEERSIARLIMLLENEDVKIDRKKNNISAESEYLLKQMLIKNPDKRISWDQLFEINILEDGTISREKKQSPKKVDTCSNSNKISNFSVPLPPPQSVSATINFKHPQYTNKIQDSNNNNNESKKHNNNDIIRRTNTIEIPAMQAVQFSKNLQEKMRQNNENKEPQSQESISSSASSSQLQDENTPKEPNHKVPLNFSAKKNSNNNNFTIPTAQANLNLEFHKKPQPSQNNTPSVAQSHQTVVKDGFRQQLENQFSQPNQQTLKTEPEDQVPFKEISKQIGNNQNQQSSNQKYASYKKENTIQVQNNSEVKRPSILSPSSYQIKANVSPKTTSTNNYLQNNGTNNDIKGIDSAEALKQLQQPVIKQVFSLDSDNNNQKNQQQENKVKLGLQMICQERNKLLFLQKVLLETLELNINEYSSELIIWIHKYIMNSLMLVEQSVILRKLDIQVVYPEILQKISQEELNMLQKQEEYLQLVEFLKKDVEQIKKQANVFEKEFGNEMMQKIQFTPKGYKQIVSQYVQKSKQEQNTQSLLQSHLIKVIDTAFVNLLFSEFQPNYQIGQYFENLCLMSNEEVLTKYNQKVGLLSI